MKNETRFMIGDQIDDRFRVYDVRMGGMGEVYLVLNSDDGQPYALKTIRQRYFRNPDFHESFHKEVLNWINLERHPYIVTCYGIELLENQYFALLEWVSGIADIGNDLRALLNYQVITQKLAIEIVAQICLGLIHANIKSPGIVHRDLKPENVLITSSYTAKITDFGLAKLIQGDDQRVGDDFDIGRNERHSLWARGNIVGTPAYMAPEQWLGGELDFRCDMYALGCIFFELVVGKRPFQSMEIDDLRRQHLEKDVEKLLGFENLHSKIKPIIQSCMAKKKEDRPAQLSYLMDQLVDCYTSIYNASLDHLQISPRELSAQDYVHRGVAYDELKKYDTALSNYAKAIEITPNTAEIYLNRGVTYRKLERYSDALADYNKALQLNPDLSNVYLNRSAVLLSLGNPKEALVDLNKFIEYAPESPVGYMNRAAVYSNLGKLAQALTDIDRAISLKPNDARGYKNRGSVLFDMGRYDDALLAINKAIELNPADGEFYSDRALVNLRSKQRNLKKAYEDLTLAKQFGSKSVNLGMLEPLRQMVKPESIDKFQSLLETTNFDDPLQRIEMYLATQQYDKANEELTNLILSEPEKPENYARRGLLMQLMAKWDDAVLDYTKAIELGKNDPGTYFGLRGLFYKQIHRYEDAVRDLNQAIRFDPNNPATYFHRAVALFTLGQTDTALTDLDSSIRLDPANSEAYFYRSNIRFLRQQYELARADGQKVIELDPRSASGYGNLGNIYSKQQKFDLAIIHYSKALDISPKLPELHFNLGKVYDSLGKFDKAMEYFNSAIECDSEFEPAYVMLAAINNDLQKYQAAIDNSSIAIKINQKDPLAYLNRGLAQMNLQQIDRAFADFRHCVMLDPNFAQAYNNIGSLFFEKGALFLGLVYVQKAAQLNSSEALLNLNRAVSEIKERYKNITSPQMAFEALRFSETFEDVQLIAEFIPDVVHPFFVMRLEIMLEKEIPETQKLIFGKRLQWLHQIAGGEQ